MNESKIYPQCGNCRFWSYPNCKRHAPIHHDASDPRSAWPRPPLAYADWCGDYEVIPGFEEQP